MANTPVLVQGPVEARSLSSITALAANPPAYPRNPTQEPLEPLVLYIVRVPGSRGMDLIFFLFGLRHLAFNIFSVEN